ncbi:hypothetical protein DICVIV_05986 [Dictyocaulus viviparus]|uniref:Sphingomyelin synthase-like domain-containing protein n=1 Tax=Dictyocaulus viviparus TaxID=29172 RepID=A0A0D8XVW4_DICVI|nr:hypothetical protein DICVIV_05986 [Dictyocaulus viviparus]
MFDKKMIDKGRNEILPTLTSKCCVIRRSPTLLAMAFVAIGWTLNEFALAWIHERVPRDMKPLPDLWFSWFPEKHFRQVGGVATSFFLCGTFIHLSCVLHYNISGGWCRDEFFSVRHFHTPFVRSALQYFRFLKVPVPSVNTYCAPKTNGSWYTVSTRVARMFWSAGIEQLRPRELCGDLIVSGHTLTIFTSFYAFKYYAPKKLKVVEYMQLRPRELCGDLIVSGHTLTIFTSFYAFKYYAPKKLKLLSFVLGILSVIAVIAILLARKHYTIDVVLGYVSTLHVSKSKNVIQEL